MREFRKRYWTQVALCASFLPLIHSPIAYTADVEDPLIAAVGGAKVNVEKDQYTVNFNNISIIEFVRFASKITNLNFVFEEADLQFTVTVVSEEPVTAKSVMSALAQVLRVHDLTIVEQDGNVLITASKTVNQIPTIISSDLPNSKAGNAVLVTRVFRIKNANVNTVAGIIRPMVSAGALIEVSAETRQLIVTDITTSIDQIAALLTSIDAPHTPLDVDTYVVKNIAPNELIAMTEEILKPFSEGNPLIFVPQADTNSIYIVSTPYLIERAMTVMEDLDIPPKTVIVSKQGMVGKNVFLYQPLHRSTKQLLSELGQIANEIKNAGGQASLLQIALENVQEIQDSNSLMFVADPETTTKIKDILASIDTLGGTGGAFYLYKIQNAPEAQIAQSLNQLQNRLQSSKYPDKDLIAAIQSMKWIQETNSLVFTGSDAALKKLKEILPTFDIQPGQIKGQSIIWIYKPQYVSPDQIQAALKALIPTLEKTNNLGDQNLATTIEDIKWHPETDSFMVSATSATIERLNNLVKTIDNPQQTTGSLAKGFFLYKLQSASCEQVLTELKNITNRLSTSSLQNQNLINAIHKIECIKSTNSLLITGSNDTIEQVKTLIADFDVPLGTAGADRAFLIYNPKFLPAQDIQAALNDLETTLSASGLDDPALLKTLSTMRYVDATKSLVFTGNQETLDKVKVMIDGIDTSAALGAIRNIGNVTFLLYKIQTAAPDKLLASLKAFADNLKQSNSQDKILAETINSAKLIKETNTLLFTGPADALQKLEQILKNFDTAALQGSPVSTERAAANFVIYNPKYLTGPQLITILCDFVDNLMNSGVSDPGLFDAINNLKWIDKTSSLLISGSPQSIEKVQQLLVKFDVPGKGDATPSIESIDNTSFLVYKLQYHPGNDIQTALKQVAASLSKTTNPPVALVDAVNSLQWIEITNSLLSTGQQDVLVKLKDLIQNLDIPLRQVFIEVLVIRTGLTNTQDFGLQWGSQAQYFNKLALGTGNFPVNPGVGTPAATPVNIFKPNLSGINATTTPKGGGGPCTASCPLPSVPFTTGFDLGAIGDIIMHKGKSFISLGALVNALQTDTDSTILLNPKIITQDNRQSTIFVGSNVPYTGAIVTNTSNNTTSTANIEYRDVGVSLTITPILGDNDIVTMDIINDISQVISDATTTSTQVLTGITTSHTHMETRVHVPNNYFVALSGMINETKTHYKTGIPCLGGLPVVGLLFSETQRTAVKDNVIIFVRPQIVTSYSEYKKITEHQEWLYKDEARLPVLKEEFDEGVDLIKLPENE